MRNPCFVPICLFIQSFLFINMNSEILILYFVLQSKILYIFCCSNYCGFIGHWTSFSQCLQSFDIPQLFLFLNTFLYFDTISRIIYIFCSSIRISHFSKKPRFPLLESSIRNQYLCTGCAHWCLGVNVSRIS